MEANELWTSPEAETLFYALLAEIEHADGEDARLLIARCEWLIREFTMLPNGDRLPAQLLSA